MTSTEFNLVQIPPCWSVNIYALKCIKHLPMMMHMDAIYVFDLH